MLAFSPAYSTQPDFIDPLHFSISPVSSTTPDFTSSSSPESADHQAVPEPSTQILNGRKTRVVRGADGSLRNCSICGDLATGWHYDVLSCNGCKTFFRRTLISKRRFVCSRGGDCQFTKDFRCACRACRFDKCVAAGMNPKAIHYPGKGPESPEHLQMVPVTISQMNSEDFEYSQKLKLMMHREKIIQQMRTAHSPIFPTGDLDQILRQPCLFGKHNIEQTTEVRWGSMYLLCERFLHGRVAVQKNLKDRRKEPFTEAMWQQIKLVRDVLKPLNDVTKIVQHASGAQCSVIIPYVRLLLMAYEDREHCEYSSKLYDELVYRIKYYLNDETLQIGAALDPRFKLDYLLDEDVISVQTSSLASKQKYEESPFIFWIAADLYLTIEYAKTFLCFQNMTEKDQRCLVSHVGGVVQVASEAYYSVLQEAESVSYPDGFNVLQTCMTYPEKRPRENFYREIYCKPVSLIRQLKLSMEEFVLFKALALFSPNEIDLSRSAREEVARKRLDILKYLRKLLTTKYGYKRGIEKLADCLFALPVFLQLAEKRRNYFLLADLSKKLDLPALLRTVYLHS